jgi:hypothetical protein
MAHRWLFFWNDMTEPTEVERMIARFPRAQAAGFNGVVFPAKLAPAKPRELKEAAARHGLALIPVIMGRSMDTHYTEGLPVRDALFVAGDDVLHFQPDNPTTVRNAGFERVRSDGFAYWTLFSDAGKRAFVEHKVVHSGRIAVYMVPDSGHCYLSQRVRLQPFRHYRASLWTRTVGLLPSGQGVGITVTDPKSRQQLTFQNTRVKPFEEWTEHHVIFNSLEHTEAIISLGAYFPGQSGQLWMDDFTLEEIPLVNVLRRPGCPITIRGENGTRYEEGRDFMPIVDSRFHVRDPYHEPPVVLLTPDTRIQDGERLRVSYYHPSGRSFGQSCSRRRSGYGIRVTNEVPSGTGSQSKKAIAWPAARPRRPAGRRRRLRRSSSRTLDFDSAGAGPVSDAWPGLGHCAPALSPAPPYHRVRRPGHHRLRLPPRLGGGERCSIADGAGMAQQPRQGGDDPRPQPHPSHHSIPAHPL